MFRKEREKARPAFGEIQAFLGEGTEFKGVLSFAGAIRIDGAVEGEILGDDLLVVGEPARINAEIEVGTLVISGHVSGNLTARRRVELLASSRVTGTIRTPALVVGEGAVFNGHCDMGGPPEASEGLPRGTPDQPTL